MQKKEWIPVGAALLLLAFGAVYDYQITDTLYQTLPMTGMIFERFLLLPVQMMTVLAMAMLFRVKKNAFYLLIGYAAGCLTLLGFPAEQWCTAAPACRKRWTNRCCAANDTAYSL